MFVVERVNLAEARRFALFSIPACRGLSGRLGEGVIAMGATLLGRPVGLALARIFAGSDKTAHLLSIFVAPSQRRVGVASSLMAALESELRALGCERLFGNLIAGSPESEGTDALLRKCGWSAPRLQRLICEGDVERISQLPWIRRAQLPNCCEAILWAETSPAARTAVALKSGAPGWHVSAQNPFLDEPLEPTISLALVADGAIVGWAIWTEAGAAKLRCARLFIRKDFRGALAGPALLELSLQRIIGTGKWRQVAFDLDAGSSRTAAFVRRRVTPYLTSVSESRGSEKSLVNAAMEVPAPAHRNPLERPASVVPRGLVNRIGRLREVVALSEGKTVAGGIPPVWRYDPADRPIGPLNLLILQPTPFCNIDCRYCYLPDRNSTATMDMDTVTATIERLKEARLFSDRVEIAWHAGEPLVVGQEFYVEAVYRIRQLAPSTTVVRQTIQTNGTLLDEPWCVLLKSLGINVGLSLDGPGFIHDAARVTRSGKGTFESVVRALRLLQQTGVPHYLLTVLTSISLQHPDEMFEFFRSHRVARVGFLSEEVVGIHRDSTLTKQHIAAYSGFMSRFYDLCQRYKEEAPWVREFSRYESLFIEGDLSQRAVIPQPWTPFGILTVDCAGRFATFSPELVDMKDLSGEPYALGNVHRDSLRGSLETARFQRMDAAMRRGIGMCQTTCDYFTACGGGVPSSKVSENGTLESTETLECTLRVQNLADIVLSKLEQRYSPIGSETSR